MLLTNTLETNHDEELSQFIELPELNENEWKSLHDVLLYQCASGPHHKNAAWRSAKRRIKSKLRKILDKQSIDWVHRGKLRSRFSDFELERFGILHLVERGDHVPSTASVPSTATPSGTPPASGMRADQQQVSASGPIVSASNNNDSRSQHHEDAAVPSCSNAPSSQSPMDLDDAAVPPSSSQDEEPEPESARGKYIFAVHALSYLITSDG